MTTAAGVDARATEIVDLETAKQRGGLRLVVVAHLPSAWSEAAKGIFRLKRLPFVTVRLEPGDKAVREWTRSRNAPAAMYEKEPARTGWAEILELAERLAPSPSLVPTAPEQRVRMFGLSHEVMGDGGLLWCGRVLTVDAGLETQGERGFPLMVAQYLAHRYGHAAADRARTKTRMDQAWSLLVAALGDREYFFEDRPTALDVYVASAVNIFAPPAEEHCPMAPPIRAAFESMRAELGEVPPSLLAHHARMYERHLEWPIVV